MKKLDTEVDNHHLEIRFTTYQASLVQLTNKIKNKKKDNLPLRYQYSHISESKIVVDFNL